MLKFIPKYLPKPWGGRKLETLFGRSIPEGTIGESWELVELPEHQSQVEQGHQTGLSLGTLWRRGSLGGHAKGKFPLLIKWLDTYGRLSAQVHPGTDFCSRFGFGQPKNEAWYIAHASPEAQLFIGHRKGLTPELLKKAIDEGSLSDWMHRIHPKPGDMYFIAAQTLHYTSGDMLILEVQDPSDTTFRVYDWDRASPTGEHRTLHFEDAIQCIDFERYAPPVPQTESIQSDSFLLHSLQTGTSLSTSGLRILVSVQPHTTLHINDQPFFLQLGDVVALEPSDTRVQIVKGSCLLITDPNEKTPEKECFGL